MRRNRGFWVLWGLALIGMNGCSNALTPRQQDCVWIGGISGALIGAGIGGGVGPAVDDNEGEGLAVGIGIGVISGAVLGSLVGYWTCGEEPPPPPPPRVAAPPPPPPPPPPPAPKRIILRGINFDFDKSNIKSEFVPVLDEAAQILKDNQNE